MVNDKFQSVVAFTHARYKSTRSSRPNIASGGVLYASEGQLLSGFIMNLQQFSLQDSDSIELLTAILAVALAPVQYDLEVLQTSTVPVKDKLAMFQNSDYPVKGLSASFRNMASDRFSQAAVDVKLGDKTRNSLKIARDLSKKAKLIRPGLHSVSFRGTDIFEGPYQTWASLG